MDIIYQLQGVEFEWDAEKARSNIANHGVTFEEAAEVFFDPFYQGGDASTEDEAHEFVIGYSLANSLCWSSMSTGRNGRGSFRRVRQRALRESSMKKPEEEPLLSVRPRETEVIALAIPKDTLASLRQVAAQREMSEQALLKFYIGQGATAGSRAPLWGPRAGRHGPRPRTAPPIRRGSCRHHARNPRGGSRMNGL
jgi:uncharacterized DUF497 family protein